MDWTNLATTLAKAGLTTLSTALLGPAGPAVSGMVCGWLGLSPDDPQAESKAAALIADPRIAADLKMKELDCQVELTKLTLTAETARIQADGAQVESVNATMRAEAASEHWAQWLWRPVWGFVSAAAFLVVCVLVCRIGWEAVVGKDMTAINMIPQLVGAFSWLFAIPGAILGVTAWKRGEEKIERLRSAIPTK
jgi:hypothetical protein